MKMEQRLYVVQINLDDVSKEGYWVNLEEWLEMAGTRELELRLCIYTNPKEAAERARGCDHQSRVVQIKTFSKVTDGPFFQGKKIPQRKRRKK